MRPTTFDPVGQTTVRDDCVRREIRAEHIGPVKRLWSSGLLNELTDRGLFPRSRLEPGAGRAGTVVVEHELLWPVISPGEWSFEMLRAAGTAYIEVCATAHRYGYTLKDGHGLNLLFHRGRALFVDLGSFVELSATEGRWLGRKEFLLRFVYPLDLWSRGLEDTARAVVARVDHALSSGEYLALRSCALRMLAPSALRLLGEAAIHFGDAATILRWCRARPEGRFRGLLVAIATLLRVGEQRRLLPWRSYEPAQFLRRLRRMPRPQRRPTLWSGYHDRQLADLDSATCTPRMSRVSEVIRDLAPRRVLELAGNAGVLAQVLLERSGVPRIVCTDADEAAVDKLAQRLSVAPRGRIDAAVLDFLRPHTHWSLAPAWERFRADLVAALAITHHLVLTEQLSFDATIDLLSAYTSRYLVTEFMPRGLYDGRSEKPRPAWYNEEGFAASFRRGFTLLHREQLEENRVLYVGERRA